MHFWVLQKLLLKKVRWKKSLRNTIISCISLPISLLNGDTKCITSFRSFLWIIVWEKVPAATWIEWQFWLHCLSVRENKSENRSNDPIIIVLHRKGSVFLLRFLLGSTIIIERLYCLRWSCPLNYTRTSLLSCASNSDSYFKRTCKKKERPFWHSFDSYIISDTSSSTYLTSKHDKHTNESSFIVIHQHIENKANRRLNFQIYSSKFHSAYPLYKHRTHATTFVLRTKNAANKQRTANSEGIKSTALCYLTPVISGRCSIISAKCTVWKA